MERWFLSFTSEALNKMIVFGLRHLRNIVDSYVAHYHTQRNHQGLENRIIDPGPEFELTVGEIECDECLGGILKYYRRRAA